MKGLTVTAVCALTLCSCEGGPGRTAFEEAPGYEGSPSLAIAAARHYLARAEAFGFSGAVGISTQDEAPMAEGYGLSTCGGGGRVTADTPFYIASLAKSMTAAAVLKLEASGRLAVGDSLGSLFSDLPADKRPITLEQLLTHTSGLANLPRDEALRLRTADDYVAAVLALPLRSSPGSRVAYSNSGYSLLAAVVEQVSGRAFADYLRTELFEPAGMVSTGLVSEPERWPSGALAHACNGTEEQGTATLDHHRPFTWSEFGAVGVVSTVVDLMRWARAVGTGAVLPLDYVERMWMPQADEQGYGWVVTRRRDGRRMVWHTGLLLPEGWNAQIRVYPDDHVALVVLSNRYDADPLGWSVARALDRILFGGEVEFLPHPRSRSSETEMGTTVSVVGAYRLEGGGELLIEDGTSGPRLRPRGQPAINLVMGLDGERAAGAAQANTASEHLLESLRLGGGSEPFAATGVDSGPTLSRLGETWSWISDRFGPVQTVDALHSVPAPFGDRAFLTFVRLGFSSGDSVTVRLIWDAGVFRGMSDRGAFVGVAQTVPVVPAPIPLVWTGPEVMVGHRLANGEEIAITVRENGVCPAIAVAGPTGERDAERTNCEPR